MVFEANQCKCWEPRLSLPEEEKQHLSAELSVYPLCDKHLYIIKVYFLMCF